MFTARSRALRWCAKPSFCRGLRSSRIAPVCACVFVTLAGVVASANAAEFSTQSFRVSAGDVRLARDVAQRAEELRSSLAIEWLGRELKAWPEKCLVTVDSDTPRLSGDTTYILLRGEVRHCRMVLRGSPERILDVLLPHEVVHTVLASHFRCAIPRWADEGAALSAEDLLERDRLWKLEAPRLSGDQQISVHALLEMREYPTDRDRIRSFYVQGGSLTEFLLLAGKPEFVEFVSTGIRDGWESAVQRHYGFDNVDLLEDAWQDWIAQDRPQIAVETEQLLMTAFYPERHDRASVSTSAHRAATRVVSRDAQIAVPVSGGQ